MLIVGLTGGIGCGKSVVSEYFHQKFNIPIIDADIIARELTHTVEIGKIIYNELGAEYFDDKNVLQRDKLRRAIFSDTKKRKKLEDILHPLVFDEIEKQLNLLSSDYCIIVIPLLFEKQKRKFIHRVLVIDCDKKNQIQRVMDRDRCDAKHVKAIIATQISRQERLKLADDVIVNNGSIESLNRKITSLHNKYMALSKNI